MFICYNNSNSCNGLWCVCVSAFVGIIATGVSDKYYQYTVSGDTSWTTFDTLNSFPVYILKHWHARQLLLLLWRPLWVEPLLVLSPLQFNVFWCFSLFSLSLVVLWLLIRKRLWVARRWWRCYGDGVGGGALWKGSKQGLQYGELYHSMSRVATYRPWDADIPPPPKVETGIRIRRTRGSVGALRIPKTDQSPSNKVSIPVLFCFSKLFFRWRNCRRIIQCQLAPLWHSFFLSCFLPWCQHLWINSSNISSQRT